MSDKQKYFMVVDDKRVIWGVGLTPTQAKKYALESIKDVMPQYLKINTGNLQKHPIRCSKRLYDQIFKFGAEEEDTWSFIGEVAELDEHINTKENCDEMRSLIDAAYDIIFMYKPENQINEEWKENWLVKARKHGASLDL